jgi:hypothetical protein
MYRNYEKRVKDFVIDMTNPESIIEHKDITEKVTNTRAELINERFADNPEKNRPLVFRGYISEADRIKDVIKQNRYLYYLPDYDKIKEERKKMKALSQDNNGSKTIDQNNINRILHSKYNINNDTDRLSINNQDYANRNISSKKNTISQPTMRYKPRTDLERVYDVLNGYNYDQASRDIIERQLKSINLYDYKKNSLNEGGKEESRILKRPRFLSKSLQRKTKKRKNVNSLYKMNHVYYNPDKSSYKPWQRREDLNTEAYGFLSSYHYKTHFKAAEEIAESDYKTNNKGNNNLNSVFLLPNLLPKYYKPRSIKTENNMEEKEDPFKFGEDYSSSENSEEYEDFDKNYNPIIHKPKTVGDPKTMEILTKIAFRQKKGPGQMDFKNEQEEQKIVRKNKKTGNKNYTEDNNVIINNKLYYKNTQFDQISHKILEMCNIYSPKSKFNNTVHKSKGGKTMITKGMTVGEFEKKYNIQE